MGLLAAPRVPTVVEPTRFDTPRRSQEESLELDTEAQRGRTPVAHGAETDGTD